MTDQEREQRKGTRKFMMAGAIVGLVLLVGLMGWFVYGWLSGEGVDLPQGSARIPSATSPQFHQNEGVSQTAKQQAPLANESEGAAARRILEGATGTASVTGDTRRRLADLVIKDNADVMQSVPFSVVIGSTVPQDFPLRDLPQAAADALRGYTGSRYFLLNDQLVLVERDVRRIIAIIPGIKRG